MLALARNNGKSTPTTLTRLNCRRQSATARSVNHAGVVGVNWP